MVQYFVNLCCAYSTVIIHFLLAWFIYNDSSNNYDNIINITNNNYYNNITNNDYNINITNNNYNNNINITNNKHNNNINITNNNYNNRKETSQHYMKTQFQSNEIAIATQAIGFRLLRTLINFISFITCNRKPVNICFCK